MVGDKSYDINGGKSNGLKTVGVNWGYGSKFEFIEAGADFQAEKPMDIEAIALGFLSKRRNTAAFITAAFSPFTVTR